MRDFGVAKVLAIGLWPGLESTRCKPVLYIRQFELSGITYSRWSEH
jgi:hypothetical protein